MRTNILSGITIFVVTAFFISCGGNDQKQSANEAGKKDEIPDYVTNLQKAVALKPDSAGLRLKYVAALDSIGKYKEALVHLDTLISKDSLNYGLWFTRGQIEEDSKDSASAEKSYINAIKIYPSPDAQLALANMYAEQKNDRALKICNRILDMGLGREYDAHCNFIAGIYHSRMKHAAEAIKLFDQCIAADFTYMPAYIEKGLVYFDNKQYDEALKVFQFASSVNNLYPDAYYYIARCYEMTGKKDSAIMKFQQSLSLDKNLTEAREGLKRLGE